jgi:hypothetical protein
MSTNSPSQKAGDAATDPAAALFSFWTQWMEQSARGTQAVLEAMQAAGDPQQIQRHWLDAVARSIDDFMRTPVFMEAMRQNLKMATDMKRLQDQAIQDAARQFGQPLAADITGLFERLNSTERTIVARLRAIEDRLKALESKLGASPAPGHRGSASRASDEASRSPASPSS